MTPRCWACGALVHLKPAEVKSEGRGALTGFECEDADACMYRRAEQRPQEVPALDVGRDVERKG